MPAGGECHDLPVRGHGWGRIEARGTGRTDVHERSRACQGVADINMVTAGNNISRHVRRAAEKADVTAGRVNRGTIVTRANRDIVAHIPADENLPAALPIPELDARVRPGCSVRVGNEGDEPAVGSHGEILYILVARSD